MSIFYLTSIIIGLTFQNIVKKPFTQKTNGKGLYFFSLLISLSAMLFFMIIEKEFRWNSGLLVYSLLFAIAYSAAIVFNLYAVACGSLSITSLIISYSLILPTAYGLIFLKEAISFKLVLGILLLVISIFFINKKNTTTPMNLKWGTYVILAFVGNGMSSVIQKIQQISFRGDYKNEFMILALAIVTILLSFFVIKKERHEIKAYAKAAWYLAIPCGIANGIVNLFVMVLSNIMPISLMFPIISAGGIIVTYVISRFCLKEKLTKSQFLGFLIGIVSIVFLS